MKISLLLALLLSLGGCVLIVPVPVTQAPTATPAPAAGIAATLTRMSRDADVLTIELALHNYSATPRWVELSSATIETTGGAWWQPQNVAGMWLAREVDRPMTLIVSLSPELHASRVRLTFDDGTHEVPLPRMEAKP